MSALPLLIVTREGEAVRSQSVDAEISIGRGEGNVIRLDDRAVSRRHAVIRKTPEGVQIEKQSDFAPIRLNGVECTRALMRDGDVVDIGPFRMRLDAKENKKEPVREQVEERTEEFVNAPAMETPVPSGFDPTVVLDDSHMQTADLLPTDLPSSGTSVLGDLSTPLQLDVQHIEGDSAGADLASQESDTSIFPEQNAEYARDEMPALNIGFNTDEEAATQVAKSTLDACLQVGSGLANIEKLDITKSEIFIGRGKECDLVLNDKKSSRKNAVISRVGNRYVLKDLDSSNGTYLNGESVKEADLSADDIIRIGEIEIQFLVLNPDYEKKKEHFLSVADALTPPPLYSEVPLMAGTPIDSAVPGPKVRTGLGGIYDKYVKNFGTLKPAQKVLVLLTAALVLSWYFEDELGIGEKPQKKPSIAHKAANGKPSVTADYDSLSPEKRQQIDDAIRRGTDNLRLQDFDKAIYEVKTFVYPIISDFGRAKEIERYAVEGKRRKEAIEEEAKKKNEARKLKERIAELEIQTRGFMSRRQYEQAKETFGEILSVDPDNASVSEWKQEIETWMEEQARIQQEKLVQEEINKRAWDTYNEGFELHKLGKYREAIEIYKKIPELGTDDSVLLKKFATMVKTCQESIRDLRDPHLKMARAFEQNGDLAAAFKEYQIISEIDPTHSEGWAGMDRIRDVLTMRAKIIYTEAVIAESYSDFQTAQEKFKEIIKLAPDGSLYFQRATRKLQSYLNFKTDTAESP